MKPAGVASRTQRTKVSPVKPAPSRPAAASRPAAKPASASKLGGRSGSGDVNGQEVKELTGLVEQLKITQDGLEKERDFYFTKLRDIEIVCQDVEGVTCAELVQKVLDILYATEEGFAPPDEVEVEDGDVEEEY